MSSNQSPSIAQNITEARIKANHSQTKAAQELEIDRQRLIGMEKGERPILAIHLLKLSHLYRVPVENLLGLAQTPLKSKPAPITLRSEPKSDSDRKAINSLLVFCNRYAKLLEQAGKCLRPLRVIAFEVGGAARVRRFAIEAIAAELRHLWDLNEMSPIGQRIFDLLPENGITVYKMLPAESSTRFTGASLKNSAIGHVILVNHDTPERQVVSAAHELGHLICQGIDDEIFVSYKLERNADEDLANDFACAFLMPSTGIKRLLFREGITDQEVEVKHVMMLARHYQTSYLVMLYRLKKLQIVKGGTHFDGLEMEGQNIQNVLIGFSRKSMAKPSRPSGLSSDFVSLVINAQIKGQLSLRQAANYLEMGEQEYSAMVKRLKESHTETTIRIDANDAEVIAGYA
jgi:Zn-dependent peptidase ImmA (M78 family)/DNA-binding XRE family transcriptional regulator